MLKLDVGEIRIPKESVSDDTVLLVKWHVKNGVAVKNGDLVASLETSKASFDIESPADGFVHYDLSEGSQVAVGSVLALVTDEKKRPHMGAKKSKINKAKPADEKFLHKTRFSKTAMKIIEENRIDLKTFDGSAMVTKNDVLAFLSGAGLLQPGSPASVLPEVPRRDKSARISVGTSSSQRILILGGGGHAKICIDIIKQMRSYDILGIVDRSLGKGTRILDIPVFGGEDELEKLYIDGIRLAVNGVGAVNNPPFRGKIFQKLKKIGFDLPNIIHPCAAVEPSAEMGEGNQIMANAVLGAAARIHDNCVLNAGAIVSHDTELHDNVHIAPGAVLAANINVGENTLIGMGCTVYLGLNIGSNVVIHNGCDIALNIPNGKVIKR